MLHGFCSFPSPHRVHWGTRARAALLELAAAACSRTMAKQFENLPFPLAQHCVLTAPDEPLLSVSFVRKPRVSQGLRHLRL